MSARNDTWQGMNWCRQDKRLSIYLRDGLACVWCLKGVEHGTKLTLDHLKPVSKGGDNGAHNLVTACSFCNTSRNNKGVKGYAAWVAARIGNGVTSDAIVAHVRKCAKRSLAPYKQQAKSVVAERGSCAKYLQTRVQPKMYTIWGAI